MENCDYLAFFITYYVFVNIKYALIIDMLEEKVNLS